MDILLCPVCATNMISPETEPRILASCGHTICLSCLKRILTSSRDCPLCRKKFDKDDISAFPKNYHLFPAMEQKIKESCLEHSCPLDLVCMDCKIEICNKCYLKGVHKDHKVDLIKDFFEEILDRINDIRLWTEKVKEHYKEATEHVTILKKAVIDDTTQRFDQLIETLTHQKKKCIDSIEKSFENIKTGAGNNSIPATQFLFFDKEIEEWLNKRTIDKAFCIYSFGTEEIQKAKSCLSTDLLHNLLQNTSRLEVKFKNDFLEQIKSFCEITINDVVQEDVVRHTYLRLGEAYENTNRIQSMKFYLKCLDLPMPENDEIKGLIYEKMAHAYIGKGDITKSLQYFQKAISVYTSIDEGHEKIENVMSQIKILKSERDQLIENLKRGEILNPIEPTRLKGIENLEKIGYMTSIFYCLGVTPQLSSIYLTLNERINSDMKTIPCTGNFTEFLEYLWFGNKSGQLASKELRDHFAKILKKDLNGYQDANEFSMFFLNSMFDEAQKLGIKSQLEELFSIRTCLTITCPDCNTKHLKTQISNSLSLPFPDSSAGTSKFFAYFIYHNINRQPFKFDLITPSTRNTHEILKSLGPTFESKENNLFIGLCKNHNLIEIAEDSTDALYLKNHAGIPFVYEIPDLIDENDGKMRSIINVYVSAQDQKDGSISYTRVITWDPSDKIRDIKLKVYERMRRHIKEYFISKQISISIDLSSNFNLQKEYDKIFLNPDCSYFFYDLYIKKKAVRVHKLSNIDDNLTLHDYLAEQEIPSVDFSLELNFPDFFEYSKLKLNTCITKQIASNFQLNDTLNLLTRKDKLDKKNLWYCECCKASKQAKIKFDIKKTSEILILTLQRYKGCGYAAMTPIDIPKKLDLKNYVDEDQKSGLYKLYGIVDYDHEHYSVNVMDPLNGLWYSIDGNIVYERTEDEIDEMLLENRCSYILFYKRTKE